MENVKIMEEKELIKETDQEYIKLEWEAPKLFCLDKNQTESGPDYETYEGVGYGPS